MSVWIYLLLTKSMITIECAPQLDQTLVNNITSYSTKLENEIKTIHDIISATVAKEENKAINNTTLRNHILKSDTQVETTKKDIKLNDITKPLTETKIPNPLSQENFISDTDSSSDWLDSELGELKLPKSNHSSTRAFPEKEKCNKCPDGIQSATIEENTTKENKLNERSEIEPLYDDATKLDETSKRETKDPPILLMKILRSVAGVPPEALDGQSITIDGYEYDINICRYHGQRYLCGYDKNKGEFTDTSESEDVGNGCVIRGDRLECGYKVGPWDVQHRKLKLSFDYKTNSTNVPTQGQTISQNGGQQNRQPPNISNSTNLTEQRQKNGRKACYEQDNRIVCYDIPLK